MRIPAVDGLRGLAILMVIYQHSLATAVGRKVVAATGWKFGYLVQNGWMGVGLFFLLSGFVLALPYFSDARRLNAGADVSEFLKHRARRLLPLFVFMAFVGLAFTFVRGAPAWRSLWLTLTTLSMFSREEFFPTINGPFWSLALEIWFSTMFPLVLMAAARWGLARTLFVVLVTSFVMRMCGAFFPFADVHVNPVKDFVLGRLDDFCIGMAIAWFYAKRQLPRVPPVALLAIALLVLLATAWFWDLRVQGRLPLLIVPALNNLAQIGFGSMLLAALQPGNTWFTSWPLRLLGAMCFSLYCWHGLLITPRLLADPFNPVRLVEFATITLVLAALTYHLVEFPRANLRELLLLPSEPKRLRTGPVVDGKRAG